MISASAVAFLLFSSLAAQTSKTTGLDTSAIDRALGRSGQAMPGDVYRVGFPRTDLSVTVGGVQVKAGFALGSWAAFKSLGVLGAAAHGDLVLTDTEINPVISALQQHNIEITALHNHLINESPSVMYLHFWGKGDAATLAAGLKDALSKTNTPMGPPAAAVATTGGVDELPAEQIQQAIGLKGTVTNGVLALSQPRPETIEMMGVTLPPSMGMATAINFQSAGGGKVAATGDFVMIADEVNKVARTLRQHNIAVTALHNHMLHGSPELYFMHFWGEGEPTVVAAGLKAALAEVKRP
jgi:hypothetical protein